MAALPPWPHAPSATETRVIGHSEVISDPRLKPSKKRPCSVRIHGDVTLVHGIRRIMATTTTGPWGGVAVTGPSGNAPFDHRVEVADIAAFVQSDEAFRRLIRWMLAEAPVTGEYDLAAQDWAKVFLPNSLRHDGGALPWKMFDLDIEIPDLLVLLLYSEPKALLLACKEADTAVAGSKRRREPGELCAVYLLELETGDEEAVGLPCSHAFHTPCIAPWFYRASTCPSCRHDTMECFSLVRAAWHDARS